MLLVVDFLLDDFQVGDFEVIMTEVNTYACVLMIFILPAQTWLNVCKCCYRILGLCNNKCMRGIQKHSCMVLSNPLLLK